MTHKLYSHQAWLDYYHGKAAELPDSTKSNPVSLKSRMLAISQSALDSRVKQLRESDSYRDKKLKTAIAGLILFLKIQASIEACEEFTNEALQAFGLSDATGLVALARQETSGRDNLAMNLLATLGNVSFELIANIGTHATSEV